MTWISPGLGLIYMGFVSDRFSDYLEPPGNRATLQNIFVNYALYSSIMSLSWNGYFFIELRKSYDLSSIV
jgi:hypothetical protein